MGKFFKVNVQVQDGYIFCGDESNRLYMDDFSIAMVAGNMSRNSQ